MMMGKLPLILAAVIVLALLGGDLFLAFYNFPTPSTTVEKVLPDARFPK